MELWKPMSVGSPRTVPRMTKEALPTCRVSPAPTPSWMGIASSTTATPGSPTRAQMPGGVVSTSPYSGKTPSTPRTWVSRVAPLDGAYTMDTSPVTRESWPPSAATESAMTRTLSGMGAFEERRRSAPSRSCDSSRMDRMTSPLKECTATSAATPRATEAA